MNKNLVVKQIDGAELRYLKESGAEDYDPACLKEIVSMIDAMLANLESQQKRAVPAPPGHGAKQITHQYIIT